MKTTFPLFQGFARCLMVAGLSSAALAACSDDPVTPSGGAGTSSGGSAAGTATGGSTTNAGTSSAGMSNAGTSSAGTSSAGTSSGGAGGTSSAGTSSGGTSSGGAGGSGGGSGGAAGGSAGTGGGSAGTGGGAGVTAKATITATTGNTIAGTATFVDTAGIIKLTLAVTAGCPAGVHDFHLHANAMCGADGMAAGAHWVPKGEGLGTLTCAADGTGTATYTTPSAGYWTIGGDAATDLTLHAVMVHASAPMATGRIGCGVPVKQ